MQFILILGLVAMATAAPRSEICDIEGGICSLVKELEAQIKTLKTQVRNLELSEGRVTVHYMATLPKWTQFV